MRRTWTPCSAPTTWAPCSSARAVPSEAEAYFRSAQRGLAEQLGPKDPEALRSADNLAVTLMVPEMWKHVLGV